MLEAGQGVEGMGGLSTSTSLPAFEV